MRLILGMDVGSEFNAWWGPFKAQHFFQVNPQLEFEFLLIPKLSITIYSEFHRERSSEGKFLEVFFFKRHNLSMDLDSKFCEGPSLFPHNWKNLYPSAFNL